MAPENLNLFFKSSLVWWTP